MKIQSFPNCQCLTFQFNKIDFTKKYDIDDFTEFLLIRCESKILRFPPCELGDLIHLKQVHTVWKKTRNSLSLKPFFRQITILVTYLVLTLLSRIFFVKKIL